MCFILSDLKYYGKVTSSFRNNLQSENENE